MVKENQLLNGKKHLGAAAESDSYKQEYINRLLKDWNSQLPTLSAIAES